MEIILVSWSTYKLFFKCSISNVALCSSWGNKCNHDSPWRESRRRKEQMKRQRIESNKHAREGRRGKFYNMVKHFWSFQLKIINMKQHGTHVQTLSMSWDLCWHPPNLIMNSCMFRRRDGQCRLLLWMVGSLDVQNLDVPTTKREQRKECTSSVTWVKRSKKVFQENKKKRFLLHTLHRLRVKLF